MTKASLNKPAPRSTKHLPFVVRLRIRNLSDTKNQNILGNQYFTDLPFLLQAEKKRFIVFKCPISAPTRVEILAIASDEILF